MLSNSPSDVVFVHCFQISDNCFQVHLHEFGRSLLAHKVFIWVRVRLKQVYSLNLLCDKLLHIWQKGVCTREPSMAPTHALFCSIHFISFTAKSICHLFCNVPNSIVS